MFGFVAMSPSRSGALTLREERPRSRESASKVGSADQREQRRRMQAAYRARVKAGESVEESEERRRDHAANRARLRKAEAPEVRARVVKKSSFWRFPISKLEVFEN